MLQRFLVPAFCLAALLSACTQSSGGAAPIKSANSAKKDGAISCDGFIKPGSALDTDIKGFAEKPVCERAFHPGGEGYLERYQLGAYEHADGTKRQLWALFARVYGDLGGRPAGIDENTFEGDKNFHHLPDVMPQGLPGNLDAARVSTFDMPHAALVCLDAFTSNKNGSHSVVTLCRTAPLAATDAERRALAEAIAANDMPGVTP